MAGVSLTEAFCRRHKCEQCKRVFVCAACTNAAMKSLGIVRQRERYEYSLAGALYAKEHQPNSINGMSKEMWLCSACQRSKCA